MNKLDTKKVKKRKFNFLRTLVFFLIMYLIYETGVYLYNLPIKNIVIIGNEYVSDKTIIETASIKNYPSIFKVNSSKIIKRLEKNSLINKVKIKKKYGSILEITVIENIPLFYKKETEKLVLSNQKEVDDIYHFKGLPTLINYVPKEQYSEFISKYIKVNLNVRELINTIEYLPLTGTDGEVVESDRFLLTMNDSNVVYVTPSKLENLNYYLDMLSSLGGKKGYIYLDSGDYDNFIFKQFGE